LVAVGGGSSMDTAKAIGVLLTHGGKINDWCGENLLERDITPVIAIPTTAGTGSEVTPFAVITDTVLSEKLNIVDNKVAPKVALIDPSTILKLPSKIMAACGIDALTHAVEAYTCKISTPHTDAFALYAIELINKNLKGAVDNPNIENCTGMMLGSTIAGLAFGFSDTAGVHCMAEALGGRYDVPHGVANAMILPTVTRYNVIADIEKYARVARIMGVDSTEMSEEEVAYASADVMEKLCNDVGIPKMKGYGNINPDDFEELSVAAEKNVSTPDNPREITSKEFYKLFVKAYNK
jgi:alcohol dehydrogenase